MERFILGSDNQTPEFRRRLPLAFQKIWRDVSSDLVLKESYRWQNNFSIGVTKELERGLANRFHRFLDYRLLEHYWVWRKTFRGTIGVRLPSVSLEDFSDYVLGHDIIYDDVFLSRNVRRLAHDYFETISDYIDALCNYFGQRDWECTGFKSDAGDTHEMGTSVCRFEIDGAAFYVKGGQSSNYNVFFNFLRDFFSDYYNSTGGSPVEFIDADRLISSEVKYRNVSQKNSSEYFYYAGILLAICTCLRISDQHFENIICNGVCPVPVDLETLFQPKLSRNGRITSEPFLPSDTGLLGGVRFNTGGLLANESFQLNLPVGQILSDRQKGIVLSSRRVMLTPRHNYPVNTAGEFYEFDRVSFFAGFRYGSRIIEGGKEQIVEFFYANLKSLETRIIFRPTLFYSGVIDQSLRGKQAKSDTTRKNYITECLGDKLHSSVLAEEKSALMNFYIPRVSVRHADNQDHFEGLDSSAIMRSFHLGIANIEKNLSIEPLQRLLI